MNVRHSGRGGLVGWRTKRRAGHLIKCRRSMRAGIALLALLMLLLVTAAGCGSTAGVPAGDEDDLAGADSLSAALEDAGASDDVEATDAATGTDNSENTVNAAEESGTAEYAAEDDGAAEASAEDAAAASREEALAEQTAAVKKEIADVDENAWPFDPLLLDSIVLLEDGRLLLDTEGALKEAVGDDVTVAEGVRDVFLLSFGNGGFRSVVFLREDGTVSAINATELITNRSIQVMDNLGGYRDVVSVESLQEEDGSLIEVVTADGERYLLDPYLR